MTKFDNLDNDPRKPDMLRWQKTCNRNDHQIEEGCSQLPEEQCQTRRYHKATILKTINDKKIVNLAEFNSLWIEYDFYETLFSLIT